MVIGGIAAAWLYSSQVALPGDLADVRDEPRPVPEAPVEPAAEGAYPAAAAVPGVILLMTRPTSVGVLVLHATAIARPQMGLAALFWAAAIALVLLARATGRGLLSQRFTVRERTLIVGAGQVGSEIAR